MGLMHILRRNPSTPIFLLVLAAFVLVVTLLAEGSGFGIMSTSFVKTLGKTLCLCLVALAMDLNWGFAGILSLGHMAFFALGGYMVGMWLMYARTAEVVIASLANSPPPATVEEIPQGVGTQVFGVVGGSEIPAIWAVAGSFPLQMALGLLAPGLLALVLAGWRCARVSSGVYLSILALALYLFQNESGLRGNNGLSGLQNLPGLGGIRQDVLSIRFFWASALALGLGYLLVSFVVSGKFGSVIRAIRDYEARVRPLGYSVEGYKLFLFVLTAVIAALAPGRS